MTIGKNLDIKNNANKKELERDFKALKDLSFIRKMIEKVKGNKNKS